MLLHNRDLLMGQLSKCMLQGMSKIVYVCLSIVNVARLKASHLGNSE